MSDRLRLLFTLPSFWPHVYRGSERIVHDIAEEMSRRGHDTTVVTRHRGLPRRASMDGFTVRYWPYPVGADRLLEPYASFAADAFVAGLRGRPSLLCGFYPSDAAALALAGRARRVPAVLAIHGVPDAGWWQENRPLTHRMMRYALRHAAAVSTLSAFTARRLAEDYDVEATVLHPGMRVERWALPRPRTERRTLVCTAAVDDYRKRPDILVTAFGMVAREEEDLRLLFVGPGDPAWIRGLADALPGGAGGRVELRPPPSDPAELPRILAGCTVGCLVSQREAFGMVLPEYLAAGLTVVATDDGAAGEIVTGPTGRLVTVDDAEACAEGIREALRLAAEPGIVERCRERARAFDWSARGDAHEAFFRGVAGAA